MNPFVNTDNGFTNDHYAFKTNDDDSAISSMVPSTVSSSPELSVDCPAVAPALLPYRVRHVELCTDKLLNCENLSEMVSIAVPNRNAAIVASMLVERPCMIVYDSTTPETQHVGQPVTSDSERTYAVQPLAHDVGQNLPSNQCPTHVWYDILDGKVMTNFLPPLLDVVGPPSI